MQIIPFQKIELITSLPKDEVERILANNIQANKGIVFKFSRATNKKLFEGRYSNGEFNIQRVINYKNSFRPQIKGKISAETIGTKITAELKMHEIVIIFMVFWLGGVALASIVAIYSMIANGVISYFLFIPIAMLIFGCGMGYFGFKFEADKSINELKRILKARLRK